MDSSTGALPVRARLEDLEETIERGLTTFVEVGNAIREIRDSRLYRETHPTFEAYCRERWGWSRRYANMQVEAAETVEAIGNHGSQITNERQARALAPLAKEDPDEARSLWSGLATEHGDELTAKHVEKAQREVREARAMRSQLPEKTRAVIEESDPEDHSLSRNPAQLRHLMDISRKHGDEEAARVALTVADGEFRSTFDAYPETKATRSGMGVHYTSDTGEWYTPGRVVGKVVSVLGEIDLDPCADPGKEIPARAHLTKHEDGLVYEWNGRVYMNPPYGKEIAPWVKKLKRHHEAGDVPAAIALLPARTDTAWFALLDAYPRCFVRGRLKFSGGKNSAPFPSAAVYMGPPEGKAAFLEAFADLGTVFERTVV